MSAENTVTILAILTSILVAVCSWQTAQLARLRRDIATVTTGLAVIQQEIMPAGQPSHTVRIGALETRVVVLEKDRRP